VAEAIRAKLAEQQPGAADYFASRLADFDRRLAEAEARWTAQMAPHRGLKVVTYHRSWSNFCERFGIEVIGYIEPRPGIPPAPGHLLELIGEIKRQNVRLLIIEPYFDLRTPNSVARQTGAEVLVLLPSVGGLPEVSDYIKLFDHDLRLLLAAIGRSATAAR
jgi:ABC-type Zn uptake system ZnuABC Zn-binding protein ZnuA